GAEARAEGATDDSAKLGRRRTRNPAEARRGDDNEIPWSGTGRSAATKRPANGHATDTIRADAASADAASGARRAHARGPGEPEDDRSDDQAARARVLVRRHRHAGGVFGAHRAAPHEGCVTAVGSRGGPDTRRSPTMGRKAIPGHSAARTPQRGGTGPCAENVAQRGGETRRNDGRAARLGATGDTG